ncbi:hypothetical protein FUAX_29390 [Fulvitalea axinellae]|uniref:Uncharacterized protein n=1 Tax=Fulvitalea axinellae TaxID=1182444 RepID=A0AAU9CYG3_9BACT|nr:hypothetical protein FUAX_29390 [Fulvitalea axinellae]
MKRESLSPENIIESADYAKIATTLVLCQAFLTEGDRYLQDVLHSALGKGKRENSLERAVVRIMERRKELQRNIRTENNNIAEETDELELQRLRGRVKRYEGELEELEADFLAKKSTSFSEVSQTAADFLALSNKYEAYRQAVINYINDYVVPGNIGEGTVVFDGVEYTASLVEQP